MSRISYAFIAMLLVGCSNDEQEPDSLSRIYNCIMNYEINLIMPCEQYVTDSLVYEDIPDGIVLKSFPPFDSLACIKTISNNLMITNEYLNKHCIIIKLNSLLKNNSRLINPITYKRAKTYLSSMKVKEISIDLSILDIKKSGVEVTKDIKNCKNQFSDIYNFSYLLLNEENDRAVVFGLIQSHSEQKAAYFLRKLGEVWYLEVKEHM